MDNIVKAIEHDDLTETLVHELACTLAELRAMFASGQINSFEFLNQRNAALHAWQEKAGLISYTGGSLRELAAR